MLYPDLTKLALPDFPSTTQSPGRMLDHGISETFVGFAPALSMEEVST